MLSLNLLDTVFEYFSNIFNKLFPGKRMEAAKKASQYRVTINVHVQTATLRTVRLIAGHKIWKLDGKFYVAEDFYQNGHYLIRRTKTALLESDMSKRIDAGLIVLVMEIESEKILVEIET